LFIFEEQGVLLFHEDFLEKQEQAFQTRMATDKGFKNRVYFKKQDSVWDMQDTM
jgi:hypothetical protein